LLREVREVLSATGNSTVPWIEKPAIPDLLGVAHSIQRDACDFVASLVQTFSAANNCTDSTFPIETSFVDLMAGLSGSSRALLRSDSRPADSVPTGEFLGSFFSPTIWSHENPDSANPQMPRIVTVELEESMHAITFHRSGYDMFDVSLSCAPEANYFFCRFPSSPEPLLKEGILKRLGFFVQRTENEITGWIDSRPLTEATAELQTVSKMAAFLLQPRSAAVRQREPEIDKFLQMCS
jgi:hypothetical protein